MAQLNVEISKELRAELKIAATQDGVSLKAWAAAALKHSIALRKKGESDTAKLSSGPESEVVEAMASPGKPSASTPSPARAKRAPKKR